MYSIISSKKNLQSIEDAVNDDVIYQKSGDFKGEEIKSIFDELIRFNFSTLILDLDCVHDEQLISSVKKFRIIKSKVRIIIIAVNRVPGDKYISSLVKLGVYDIVAPKIEENDAVLLSYLVEVLSKEPALYSQAARWDTKDYIDSNKNGNAKGKVIKKEVVKIVEKEVEKKVEIINTSIITVLSGAPTGKTFLTWNLAHCFANRNYKVSVINLDRGYSANIFFGVPEGEQAFRGITNEDEITEDILNKGYRLNNNLEIFTGELCTDNKISVQQFLKLLNIVQSQSDITIIDFSENVNEVLEVAILHSNLNLMVFDIDNMHYHLNLKFLEEIQNLNFRKTIAVINNAFIESQEVKNTENLINEIGFNRICTIRNDRATYDVMHTDSCTYFKTKNKNFKNDIDNLLNTMKSKEKKKSFFKKILGI